MYFPKSQNFHILAKSISGGLRTLTKMYFDVKEKLICVKEKPMNVKEKPTGMLLVSILTIFGTLQFNSDYSEEAALIDVHIYLTHAG